MRGRRRVCLAEEPAEALPRLTAGGPLPTRTPRRFPDEFEALLSPRGLALLAGRDPAAGALAREVFFSAEDLVDPRQARLGAKLLTGALADCLVELTRPLPDARAATLGAGELLPKAARMQTTPMGDSPNRKVVHRATELGLLAMVQSASYRAFVQALAGRALVGPISNQVLCYRPGDYAGPHTDHHPESPELRDGYVDFHVTFCTPGVAEQLIVYERDGHLSAQRSLAKSGTVTAYRLPFWHYTTPLQVKPGREATARRWLVLGSFHDAA